MARFYGKNTESDITLRRDVTVVAINGCFWHGHASCPYLRLRDKSPEFWKTRIEANQQIAANQSNLTVEL